MTHGYLEIYQHKQSVNPEFLEGTIAYVESSKGVTVPIVAQSAVEKSNTDTFVSSTKDTKPQPPKQEEEGFLSSAASWFGKGAESIKQGALGFVIWANRHVDIEAVGEFLVDCDLDQENIQNLAGMCAHSEHDSLKGCTGEVAARLEDEKIQCELACDQIKHCDETVRASYARCTHKMHANNQPIISGTITEHAENPETVQTVIDNMPLCAKEQQANVVACSARGVVKNKNFTPSQKSEMGTRIAVTVPKLDIQQQAKAFTALTEEMHDYEEVVTEVSNQVANHVTEEVREETIKQLSQSQYENVRQTFTKENIDRIQAEYKKQLGIVEKIDNEKIAEIIKEAKGENVADVKRAVKEALIEQAEEHKLVQQEIKQRLSELSFSSAEHSFVKRLDNASIENYDNERIAIFKQELHECKSIKDVAKVLKNYPKKVASNLFKNISKTNAKNLFKQSQDSVYMQAFLLKNGLVEYTDVKEHCNPAINQALKVFSDIEKYNEMIDENDMTISAEKRMEKDINQAITRL